MPIGRLRIYDAGNSPAHGHRQDKGEEYDRAWHATLSWDNSAKVWYVSETNFCGLAAEACAAPAGLSPASTAASLAAPLLPDYHGPHCHAALSVTNPLRDS